jgi:hypothetical protein
VRQPPVEVGDGRDDLEIRRPGTWRGVRGTYHGLVEGHLWFPRNVLMSGGAHGTTQQSETGTAQELQRGAEMLRAVLGGKTYAAVGAEFGVSRTAVERRVKTLSLKLVVLIGIDGLTAEAAGSALRLRRAHRAVEAALTRYEALFSGGLLRCDADRAIDLEEAARRLRGGASGARDTALLYVLFATGARPLEIARLKVRDYLDEHGAVREQSVLPAEAAVKGIARPLFFTSGPLKRAMAAYLRQRIGRRLGLTGGDRYWGLDPESSLFLTVEGAPFRVSRIDGAGHSRCICRPILETYRKIMQRAQLPDATARAARMRVLNKLVEQGADEQQVGLVLGVGARHVKRCVVATPPRSLHILTEGLLEP